MNFDNNYNLQVSGVRLGKEGGLFFRCYGKSGLNSTIPDRTYIVSSENKVNTLVRTIDDEIVAIEIIGLNALVSVGIYGDVYEYQKGRWIDKDFEINPAEALSRTIVMDDVLYIVGTGNTFMMLSDDGWVPVCEELSKAEEVDLYGLCYDAGNEFVVCGERGFVAKVSKITIEKFNVPTNTDINNVVSIRSGLVAICGNKGVLFVGYGDQWADYSMPDLGLDFTSVISWNGEVYVSAKDCIFILGKEGLELFEDIQSFNLIGVGDEMWSIGINCIYKYDGSLWEKVIIAFES